MKTIYKVFTTPKDVAGHMIKYDCVSETEHHVVVRICIRPKDDVYDDVMLPRVSHDSGRFFDSFDEAKAFAIKTARKIEDEIVKEHQKAVRNTYKVLEIKETDVVSKSQRIIILGKFNDKDRNF